jgi:hypothetical protein
MAREEPSPGASLSQNIFGFGRGTMGADLFLRPALFIIDRDG